jgi:hypothetical protein
MGNFTAFQNILPDPNNRINNAGADHSATDAGAYGAGYSAVSFSSNQKVLRDRTNSGRLLARAKTGHNWKIKISYNPMTREEFEPINTFLLQRRGALNPFFVSLPQYRLPRNIAFRSWVQESGGNPVQLLNNLHVVTSAAASSTGAAGSTSLLLTASDYTVATDETPLPGDLFTIDGTNSNHKKTYQVTRVETNADYYLVNSSPTRPTTNQVRIHFTPALAKAVVSGDDLIFNDPKIKVIITGDVQEYALNTDNLYAFSLSLEEVQ